MKKFIAKLKEFTNAHKHRLPLLSVNIGFLVILAFSITFWLNLYQLFSAASFGKGNELLDQLLGSDYSLSPFFTLIFAFIAFRIFDVATRVNFYKKKWPRLLSFQMVMIGIVGAACNSAVGTVYYMVVPFLEEKVASIGVPTSYIAVFATEQSGMLSFSLMGIPVIAFAFLGLFLKNEYMNHELELKEAFFEQEMKSRWHQPFTDLQKTGDKWPDIKLGRDLKTKEMVTLPGFDRALNTVIVGGIGTGKTAALGLPITNQDLHHMADFINNYPKLRERPDFRNKNVFGRHLNGISVIEPSNDLCQKVLQLAKAHGIPDELITYINPLDQNTHKINPMRGPVDKVAEVFTQVIAGLNNSQAAGNFFFEQSQRNHLKQHIYLLKLHDPEKNVTLDMLLDMYKNPNLVHKMHVQLKKSLPSNIDDIEDNEERIHWKIIKGVDEWFDLTILPQRERSGPGMKDVYTPNGEQQFYDAKAEYVQGLRNILDDLGANRLVRRVLFGDSHFDFDEHLAKGGVLLVNTAKGELVELANVLGKIVLMNLQAATFRREPDISPFHSIIVDESPDYFYEGFREFPVQSRKYKVMLTPIMQTISQLADKYGEFYMNTLIAGLRNRMVYADVPPYDAKYFSELFGESLRFEEGQSEMSVSPLQQDPVARGGSSYTRVREQTMTAGDIMFQKAFVAAVKLVVNNETQPVRQISANFVPAEEFETATVQVDPEALDVLLKDRKAGEIIINAPKPLPLIVDGENQLLDMEEDKKREEEELLNTNNQLPIMPVENTSHLYAPSDPYPRGKENESKFFIDQRVGEQAPAASFVEVELQEMSERHQKEQASPAQRAEGDPLPPQEPKLANEEVAAVIEAEPVKAHPEKFPTAKKSFMETFSKPYVPGESEAVRAEDAHYEESRPSLEEKKLFDEMIQEVNGKEQDKK
ncbi:type IV secretory system conjugative DNA transfer family protein [Planococcus lenghuensis]|uniref:TraD/TraG TraM recognition site domain-containing protein n=1 Tax=Planococcus lenghuensis TaxID=2213202 RepID=A0A1Q2L5H3_9BACL|nr:type IV secretory system conjugative DNA transfer family protein [Planococcus lenghuensis]AQQ55347.1 hypothetical protein B0X71_19430 [Planococcus lenghuensis]